MALQRNITFTTIERKSLLEKLLSQENNVCFFVFWHMLNHKASLERENCCLKKGFASFMICKQKILESIFVTKYMNKTYESL